MHSVSHLFADFEGHFVFSAMSKNRFKFLKSHITFDDYETRQANWRTDRFAAMRSIWEFFKSNLTKYDAPSEYLTIDETLYPMRHQIAFRQYNPNKPHKYGLLWKSLNDARYPYTYKAVPYAAKPVAGDGPYYINATIDYVKYLVTETENTQTLKGRTISTDRLYTSIGMTNWLLDRKITIVGTVQKGRQGVPSQLFDTNGREIFNTSCHFEKEHKNLCLTSYTVNTKLKGKRNVVVLATSRPLHGVTKDGQK